jgi:hypothetical protein
MRSGSERKTVGAAIISLCLLAASASAAPPTLLNEEQFRDRFAEVVHRLRPELAIKADGPGALTLQAPDKTEATAYISNAFKKYRDDPGQLDELLERYAHVAVETAKPERRIELDNLVVLIRPSAYINMERGPAEMHSVVRPFAGEFFMVMAVNNPDSFDIPPVKTLQASLGPLDDRIWARALKNTLSLEGRIAAAPQSDGLVALTCDNGLGGSLLLEDELWRQPGLTGKGDIVVSVAKDDLIVAHARDKRSIAALRKIVAQRADDPDLLSSTLLRRTPNGWAPYGDTE